MGVSSGTSEMDSGAWEGASGVSKRAVEVSSGGTIWGASERDGERERERETAREPVRGNSQGDLNDGRGI